MTIVLLATCLILASPPDQRVKIMALAISSWLAWSAVEYGVHRFVLHGLQPICDWHTAHHRQPPALIYDSALLSTLLIGMLLAVPVVLMENSWHAHAVSIGLLSGYLGYAVTHHAIHHWTIDNAWLQGRKRWHEQHHHGGHSGCYGVTSSFWDWVFFSTRSRRMMRDK